MRISDWSSDVCSSDLDGDWARTLGRRYGDHAAFSIAGNLCMRSLCVDRRTDGGRTLVQRLAAQADVFIEGFRPGVAQRLGLGWEELSRLNPGLIYLSVSGFGQSGPSRDRPAMDPVLQAFTGMMEANRSEEYTSELQSLMRISYAVFCLKKKTETNQTNVHN